MLPSITTTHAIPNQLPASHLVSTGKVRFCSRCLKVLVPAEGTGNGKKKTSHHCEGGAIARKPSVSVPFS
ncbi:hypothetical protein HNQ77_002221 [Silvibacterium bohemicum]|uniref:Uncharacterized protein n=1 Tax=Silvibacterium bohemicum TaxID=1577686 RepID=A0A841JX17_9BACT|nr:hypothetical protein [Silvibacterium bohemicum]